MSLAAHMSLAATQIGAAPTYRQPPGPAAVPAAMPQAEPAQANLQAVSRHVTSVSRGLAPRPEL
eukprot:5103641-Prymnesium_polylepis.1